VADTTIEIIVIAKAPGVEVVIVVIIVGEGAIIMTTIGTKVVTEGMITDN